MLKIIDIILLIVLGIPAVYFFAFAVFSRFFDDDDPKETARTRRFVTIIPAYKSDPFILDTARAAATQDYPSDRFRTLVVSDSMKPETVASLEDGGIEVIEVSFEKSTKAASLQAAMEYLGDDAADVVIILDSDNIVGNDFISAIDQAFERGAKAVQAHRTAKNRDTDIAVIDAVSEEINNSIFRKGHCSVGMTSALIGSGMAFDYKWFAYACSSFTTTGEDKEMELRLISDGIKVKYLDNVKVLDEKTRSASNYYNQRRRWTASQYNIILDAARKFPAAANKLDYADKLFQWLFPPRMIIITAIPLLAILLSLFHSPYAWQWWRLTIILVIGLLLAIPKGGFDRKLLKAMVTVPVLAVMAAINMFRMKGTKDNYIHTEHE